MLRLKSLVCTAAMLLPLAPAHAGTYPDPVNSTIPHYICVVGAHLDGGNEVPDAAGEFTVVFRDAANNPVPDAEVVIDFSRCDDIVLCQTQIAGLTIDCVTKTVHMFTDAAGKAVFRIVGGARNTGAVGSVAAPGCGLDGVSILASGMNLGSVTAAVLDQNGAIGGNGVDALDLALFSDDVGSAALNSTYRARSDYNFDQSNSGVDLAVFANHLGAAALGTGSGDGCANTAYCP
jgi:hypothetical protein